MLACHAFYLCVGGRTKGRRYCGVRQPGTSQRGRDGANHRVIERAEIEQQVQGGKEIKDVLAQLIPGMDVSSRGRTNYGMNLRGRSMMVMVDGVRLNSSRSDSRQLDSIDPFNIDRIEVISGATSLYGGGSTGGLVNIVTKKASRRPKWSSRPGQKAGLTAITTMMRTSPQP